MEKAQRKTAAEAGLRFHALDHFTVPVRDFNVARKFYAEVLGGVVTKEPDWGPFRRGRTLGAHAAVQLFHGAGHLVLYYQPWGQPAPDQSHPHRAFTVEGAEKLDEIIGRLKSADVPYVLLAEQSAAEGEPVRASLRFRDPDMNQLEITCDPYPFRPGMRVGTFDPTSLYYRWADWRALVPAGGAPE